MRVGVVGASHESTPVALLERLSLSPEAGQALLEEAVPELVEGVVLSTCNRTEIYFAAEDLAATADRVTELLVRRAGLAPEQAGQHLRRRLGAPAVLHLFRVAAGLDAMVVGESQILGQVRDAFLRAREAGMTGKELHPLFEAALSVGKRVHSDTEVGRHAVSVGYACVELAKKVFGALEGRSALLIGAGKVSELTIQHLKGQGVRDIFVANRTLERAQALASGMDAEAVAFEDVEGLLRSVDLLVTSTGAPHFIFDRTTLAQVQKARKGKPLFVFDLAVPRDVDPSATGLTSIFLYDIDNLKAVVADNLGERMRAAAGAESMVEREAEAYQETVKAREAVPVIRSLRGKAEDIRAREVARALRKLPDLSERDRRVVEAMSMLIVNKLLNDPTVALKSFAASGEGDVYLQAVRNLFNLEPKAAFKAWD